MTESDPSPLTDRDRAILDFERSWWAQGGVKEIAIGERFSLSTSRYYALLGEIMDMPEAMDHDPLLVRRLHRLRDARRRSRVASADATDAVQS